MQTPEYFKKYYIKNRNRVIQKQRTRGQEVRVKLLTILNPKQKCIRCGFTDIRALQIDHKNGRGTEEYKGNKMNVMGMYRFYLKNIELAKQNLQVLCANCNWIKKSELREHPRI